MAPVDALSRTGSLRAGVAVNGFGALTFQRAGFERFYFLERTQRVLHQPD